MCTKENLRSTDRKYTLAWKLDPALGGAVRKPFFRKQTNCWYFKDGNGAFIRLDPDEEKAYELWEKYRELNNYTMPNATVEAICEAWLEEHKLELSKERYEKHVCLLSDFVSRVGGGRQARTLKASDVRSWLETGRNPPWSVARKRDGGQFVKKVYRWANGNGWLPTSNLLLMRLESPQPRQTLVSKKVHQQMVHECLHGQERSRAFACVLIALWHSGARPIQIRELTATHVTPNGAWIFQRHKTGKKTGSVLTIHPSACLKTLVAILAANRPEGPLFLTSKGEPWTKDGIVRRLNRLKTKLKIDEPFTAYSYRHTFATDALVSGLDTPTVAALLGHKDSAMVSRVYGHLDKHSQHLSSKADEAARKRKQG